MKTLYLLTLLVFTSAFASAQIIDQFNYTGAANANGWTTHSGTAGQIVAVTTASDQGNNLSYTGLATSVGNRIQIAAASSEDINKPLTGITGTGYYSMLVKLNSTTGLNATGTYFFGFATTSGSSGVTNFGGKLWVRSSGAGFQLGVQQGTGTASFYTTELTIGQTYFVVVKEVAGASAHLFINPVPGSAEPAATVTNTDATAFSAFGSVFIRQAANIGVLELDEIRAGSAWADVTPADIAPCVATESFATATACDSYLFHGQTLTASGNYDYTIDNGNAAGCDSTIHLTLTINHSTTNTINPNSCGSYTINGQTYTTSGTYVQHLTNSVNCDSTLTIVLNVGTSFTYYQDFDTDGFGNASVTATGCTAPPGYVSNDDDCNDNDNAIGVATITYYADTDLDGLGDPSTGILSCTPIPGRVTNSTDCNDGNASIGIATAWYPDVDGDTFGSASATAVISCTAPANHVSTNTDCADNNSTIYPGATEIPDNGIDEDCNGSDLSTSLAMYEFTGPLECPVSAVNVTAQPANAVFSPFSTMNTQCNGAANVFNNDHWNMSATIDLTEYNQFSINPADCYEMDLTTMSFFHRISASGGTPSIHVRSSLDNFAADIDVTQLLNATGVVHTFALPAAFQNLTDELTFRFYLTSMGTEGATYRMDDVKLNGTLSALSTQTYYADTDEDGYGDAASSVTNCEQPDGYVTDNTDCNDDNDAEHPGAIWYADTDGDSFGNPLSTLTQCLQPMNYVSNNTDCDDTDDDVAGQTTYYADIDADGYGDPESTPVMSCVPVAGYVDNNNDCDDDDNTITVPTQTFYVDADGDGHGESGSVGVIACSAPIGHVDSDDDCNDDDNTVYPGAPELCDDLDNNCNDEIDEDLLATSWYEDADGDTFGNEDEMISDCTQPAGYVANSTDCNDTDEDIYPGATDIANNGLDENCDGVDGYLSINENTLTNVSLYPNPGTESFTIEFAGSGAYTLKIMSTDGKVVSGQMINAGTTTVSAEKLLPGIYFIQIGNGQLSATHRWIKK